MTESVRCPACRGSKKVPKLGGMIGECNTCSGKGSILAVDKPKTVVVEIEAVPKDVIKAVSECVVPTTTQDVKIDGKKAVFKRKTAASR